MYVPMVGLSLMAAGTALELIDSKPVVRRELAALACLVLAVFSAITWRQVRYWQDSETLFRHAIDEDSRNYSAWFYLGNTLLNVPGQGPDAIAAFERAVQARPDFAEAHERLARSLCAADRDVEGMLEFAEAFRIRPKYALAHFDLGSALVKMGQTAEAIAHFRAALQINPQYVQARTALDLALKALDGQNSP
jgi:tetratricopeptide (TPR) repeat protein